MDFESPDVEKDFPGLYASESGRKSNESDCKFFIVFDWFLLYLLLWYFIVVSTWIVCLVIKMSKLKFLLRILKKKQNWKPFRYLIISFERCRFHVFNFSIEFISFILTNTLNLRWGWGIWPEYSIWISEGMILRKNPMTYSWF